MISIVTVATEKNYKNPVAGLLDKRSMGYFVNLKDAISCVKQNCMDIHEEIYEYAIIESVEEGLFRYTKPEDVLWFLFDDNTKTYIETTCPKSQERVIGFWH